MIKNELKNIKKLIKRDICNIFSKEEREILLFQINYNRKILKDPKGYIKAVEKAIDDANQFGMGEVDF